jgi:hypothetical protein
MIPIAIFFMPQSLLNRLFTSTQRLLIFCQSTMPMDVIPEKAGHDVAGIFGTQSNSPADE